MDCSKCIALMASNEGDILQSHWRPRGGRHDRVVRLRTAGRVSRPHDRERQNRCTGRGKATLRKALELVATGSLVCLRAVYQSTKVMKAVRGWL